MKTSIYSGVIAALSQPEFSPQPPAVAEYPHYLPKAHMVEPSDTKESPGGFQLLGDFPQSIKWTAEGSAVRSWIKEHGPQALSAWLAKEAAEKAANDARLAALKAKEAAAKEAAAAAKEAAAKEADLFARMERAATDGKIARCSGVSGTATFRSPSGAEIATRRPNYQTYSHSEDSRHCGGDYVTKVGYTYQLVGITSDELEELIK